MDIYKDYLMHSSSTFNKKRYKHSKYNSTIDGGIQGRLHNVSSKNKDKKRLPTESPIEEAQRRNWTQQRKEETRKHEEEIARQARLNTPRRTSDAYANTGNYNVGNRNTNTENISAARRRSDAAANSGRYNTGNRMFSSFPNRNGGKSSESFWNSILLKARNNRQYIRMMTPNGEMSMPPEYWEELFGNGENAANYTYLGFGVTYAGRNTGYRPLNR